MGKPAFVDKVADNYYLSLFSPAVNAGTDAAVTTDFDGDQRPLGGGFDIGFNESPYSRLYLPLPQR